MADKSKYYSTDNLPLCSDIPGAKLWAVSLDKVMMTYFEIEPNSRFEKHSHESEQITHVLTGELYFETDDGEQCVKAGEVIALPANAIHGAYTKDLAVTAVDAWSPVRELYTGENS